MTPRELSIWLFDNTVRVESVIFLPGNDVADCSDDLRDFIDGKTNDEINEAFGQKILRPAGASDDDGDLSERREAVLEALYSNGAWGLLVQIASPVKTFLAGGVKSYSWGHYRTRWIHLPNLAFDDQFFDRMREIVDEWNGIDRNQSHKK